MNPDLQAQLAQLRDIRLPDTVSWWPLAPGWWVALALLVLTLAALVIWSVLRKRTARYLALRELDALQADTPQGFASEVSMLLRRVARRSDAGAAQLSGEPWAEYLTRRGLAPDLARYLAEATYAPPTARACGDGRDYEGWRHEAGQWIRRQA